jgi:hypothetical protein
MSEVKKEVSELRSKLAKVAPKGIAQQFEEQEETKPNPTAKLAQLRAEALK